MLSTLSIGQVATRTGRSIHTIRWYEAQGLIPGVVRDKGGRRRFSEYHVRWLDSMERLRLTGMSIAQMRAYTDLARQGSVTLRQRRALLAEHKARVRKSIEKWSAALALIDAKVEFYDEWLTNGERPSVDPHQRVLRKTEWSGAPHDGG
jgi:DNA-binding transcriptional MerR regulator